MTAPTRSPSGGTPTEAGRELDARIAEQVMGFTTSRAWSRQGIDIAEIAPSDISVRAVPHYSTAIAASWMVVERVQSKHPGWRFSLLGGDTSFAMVRVARGVEVDYGRRESFGWHAEFFGHEDPARNTGQRHASEYADTAPLAICRAALAALAAHPLPEPAR